MTTTPEATPSWLNLYTVALPETDTQYMILAKNAASAKGKFWHMIGNPPFLHAKPVAKLVKRGGAPR